ncbi:uncharacterized protein LOC110291845 [Mus caroli]|uniref:Uncharacterized protein LOC110291845 n=1 Tax=Mus caroli TaxID=10089 RepID=A0A6P5PBV9_MUSCR|nr:uncharacterized protein LOC110291845 [Mus caroli]
MGGEKKKDSLEAKLKRITEMQRENFPGDTSLSLDIDIVRFMSYDFSGNIVLSHGDEDGSLTLFVRFAQLRLQFQVEHRAIEEAEDHREKQQRLEDPLLLSGAHPVSHSPSCAPRCGGGSRRVLGPPLRRTAQQRPPREVAGHSMSRRSETQKPDRRGRGGRSAPAGGWAPGHRRHPASSHQTSVMSDFCEWLGPCGVSLHTSEPAALATGPCAQPAWFSLLPTFWPPCPHRQSPPLAPAPAAGLCRYH